MVTEDKFPKSRTQADSTFAVLYASMTEEWRQKARKAGALPRRRASIVRHFLVHHGL